METQHSVKIWDLPVRIFHWALVAFFTFSYLSGEEETPLHAWSGYAIITLLIFRLVWGFVGSQHSRFADFVRSPREAVAYAGDTLSGRAKRYMGHNPVGGLMVIALIFSLFATTLTGLVTYGVDEGKGPLGAMKDTRSQPVKYEQLKYSSGLMAVAWADNDGDEEAAGSSVAGTKSYKHEKDSLIKEVHEFFANFTLFLVFIHLLGVAFESFVHRENLVRAMVTGYKPKTIENHSDNLDSSAKQPNP
ncbi:MAG: cytochrome b/b6 domain-containing protein [Gammaproteobacteria bacterium]|nr:cytochrome b/b6 domain-containing protein [Gammaproteobacteria bacterium]